jgi:hypothetical protein
LGFAEFANKSIRMTAPITIDGYLVQAKLEAAIKQIVGDGWRGRELRVHGTKRRWDMAYELNGKITVVEFDGDEHYWNALKIKVDREKDKIAAGLGYTVVRIPYWVQLTTETLKFYFGLEAEIEQNFPHGFIAKAALLPASYCELGITRFRNEISSLPATVRNAVISSLQDRIKDYGREYVVPESLKDLV